MLIIILALLLIFILWTVSAYNNLVTSRELVKNSLGQIASQIESRWDALTSLISASKEYSSHEMESLLAITKERSRLASNSDPSDLENDIANFDNVVSKLNLIVESYPDLKASGVYENTMDKIHSYENNLRQARMIYNDTVTKYNRKVLSFPSSIIAGIFNFHEEEYFTSNENKSEMPSWN